MFFKLYYTSTIKQYTVITDGSLDAYYNLLTTTEHTITVSSR